MPSDDPRVRDQTAPEPTDGPTEPVPAEAHAAVAKRDSAVSHEP